jgi:Fe-S-cluster-containing dehydrogenase component/CRP-like cAMP-binding protein
VSTAWPAAVWESTWLRGLDARARAELEAAGRVRSLARGERLFDAGEPSDTFFVVASGIVEVRAVRRGETEARALRRAVAGDALGEHAVVRPSAPRTAEATCVTSAIVAEVPVGLFRRAVARAGGPECREQQALRRAAARDVFRTSALARAVSEADLEALVTATEHRELGRGDVLFSSGDPATHAYLVGDGMLRVSGGREEDARAGAYLTRGDLVTESALEDGRVYDVTATACGPAWVLGVPRGVWATAARRARGALEDARRWTRAGPPREKVEDPWRFAEARSMLVIDDEACVRCGHCAWSCADAHADGVSRLVRRGAKVVVRAAADGADRPFVVAGSCQHCQHPACMVDCPTGAIGRDMSGGVFIRDDVCVGCGQCARACPWGSVQMANRREPSVGLSPTVAVKCDMCRGLSGPACVSACPVDAIARIEPTSVFASAPSLRSGLRTSVFASALLDIRRPGAVGSGPAQKREPERRTECRTPEGSGLERTLPVRTAGWPWVVAATIVSAVAVPLSGASSAGSTDSRDARWLTGAVAGALVLSLLAYAAIKRGRWWRKDTGRSRTRPHAVAHVALGIVALGVVVVHTGARVAPNAAGALLGAFALASATGVLGALAYRFIPRALSRLERTAMLPEDLAVRGRDLDDRIFSALSGRSDATKSAYARWLAPYARAPLGAFALVARGTRLGDEEKRLRACVDRATLDGLDDLVRLVVERRAVRAQRTLQTLLRSWAPAHVIAVAVTVALLLVHVVCVVRGR